MSGKAGKLVVVAVIAALVGVFFAFDLGQYFSLEYIQANKARFDSYYQENRALTIGTYFLIYVAMATLNLPGAAIMTLLGGALFGFLMGTVLVSFASTVGATGAFLVSRFLLRDVVQSKFGDKLGLINKGVEEEGAFYLFTMRLVPLFPFFAINACMALTPIRVWTFYWVSQVGMLAGTAVYVNAGTEIGKISSLGDVASPTLLGSFALLGIFPLLIKKVMGIVKAKRAAPTTS